MATGHDLVGNLCEGLFASLLRRDQRLKAESYVRALLAAQGRKTLRNIAEQMGGEAAQQSVHHFISSSSWDWAAVRRSLAQRVDALLVPRAWVVRPLVIPKAGPHSVGVDQQFVPHLGHTVNAQQAFGAWLASERAAVPCNWRLVLPASWLEDPLRRHRACIPETSRAAGLEECASDAVRQLESARAGRRPVVLDAEGLDVRRCVRHFGDRRAPLLVRIGPHTPVRVDNTRLHAYSDKPVTAGQLVATMKQFRRQAESPGGYGGPGADGGVAAAIPVLPGEFDGPGPRTPMLLLADWPSAPYGAARMWLARAAGTPVPGLLRLARLADTAERDCAAVSERIGIRDFAGRSFRGWHRHITLASVAHLAAVLTTAERNTPASALSSVA
ncbi:MULTISPECIES: IS701 family transposase [unclassified Streptomyces]|uniref:IS701 family transposase n=1 Tax=unclassified Streptomyces TaxID=2593676 RepID=UPI0022B6D74A|nr:MULTISPECIES: transposase [unclassified Streptomyces]MCZ7414660.1 transposase [Streptomyces sp. WMMC897]MCZ7431589.1 transposase [Streptomyces sp. WMMC1477]